jgi:UDP-N-acetyl-D-galactosamine dehydrogenase
MADPGATRAEYGIELIDLGMVEHVDAAIWAVAHDVFRTLSLERLKQLCSNGNGRGVVMDVKSLLSRTEVESAGLHYWSL